MSLQNNIVTSATWSSYLSVYRVYCELCRETDLTLSDEADDEATQSCSLKRDMTRTDRRKETQLKVLEFVSISSVI
jgi:hypothetical protein